MTTPAADEGRATGITMEELALAARNHGMPLEALRYDLTPVGLHYLLIHFDIPEADERTWTLELGGRVAAPRTLTMEELRRRPEVTAPVTLECAGNGRARLDPRPVSQPWLEEAVGTAEWTGTPLAPLLEEAGIGPDAVEVLFGGADRGVQGGLEQDYERSLPLHEAMREEVLLAWGINGRPLPPQHGHPLRLVVPGWYGMTSVKWLRRISVLTEPFTGFQQAGSYLIARLRGRPGDAGDPHPAPLAMLPARHPRVRVPRPVPPARPPPADRPGLVGPGPGGRGRGQRRRRPQLGGRPSWSGSRRPGPGPAGASAGRRPPAPTSCARGPPTPPATPSPWRPSWNTGGYVNNAVQRVPVTVRPAPAGAEAGPA